MSNASWVCEVSNFPKGDPVRKRSILLLAATLSICSPRLYADSLTTDTVEVVGQHHFLDENTSGITNLPLPVEKVPQSVSLINNDFAKAADLKTSAELAQYSVGGLWASYSPSYGNQIWLRGFDAGYAIDGLTVGDRMAEPDSAIVERYEIVKGPASVVYGAQSPGGIVNLVSKTASPDMPSYLSVSGGSWGRVRLEGQASGTLNSSGTVRGIGVAAHEESDSFVDFVKYKKSVIYGGLDFDLAKDLTGFVRASYQRLENTPFNGPPTYPDGSMVPLDRSFFIGGANLVNVSNAARLNGGLAWQTSDLWSFDLKGMYQKTTHEGGNNYPYGYIATDGSFPLGGERFNDWQVDDYTVAASATRKLDDFGLADSSLSANVRYQHYRYYVDEYVSPLVNTSGLTPNINNGDQSISNIFNSLVPGTNTYQQDQAMRYLTGSMQAVVKVANPLTVVGGISYSQPKIDQQINFGATKSLDPGGQTSYRGALIYEPIKGLNFYGSYSESYQPNLRVDANFEVLPPLEGKQYEIGAKYLPNGRILLTAAVFEARVSNVPVYDTSIGGEAIYKASDVRHRGLELEATGRLTDRWQVKGGFALLDPKVTKDPVHPQNDGETRPWIPRITGNLFATYAYSKELAISGGARYVGPVMTYDNSSSSPTADIAPYSVFDAAMSYSFDRWLLQMNVKNVFDKHYSVPSPYFQALWAGLYPGEPRSMALSARRDF
jgi:iron complex outermembrane receptor protein